MINPAFLKVGLGGAIATSAGTVGIVYRNKIKDFFSNLSSKGSTYVIVKTSATPDSTIDSQLYTGDVKNFKCVLTSDTKKEDDKCEIFSIVAATGGKLNNLDEIKTSNTKATKSQITSNSFFKLTISDELLESSTWNGSQTIDIVEKTTGTKKFGTFSLKYQVTDNEIKGETDLIIGKVKTKSINGDLADGPTFKCAVSGENEKLSCSLFKISNNPTLVKDVVLNGLASATKTQSEYSQGNHFVIDLKRTTSKKKISELKYKTVTVVVTENNAEKAVATFEVLATLSQTVGDFSTSNLSKIIFV